MSEKAEILLALAPMIDKAEHEGKFLRCGYQDIWMSPKELRAANAKGEFIWGPVNWSLCDPEERTLSLERAVVSAKYALAQWKARISG